MKKWQIQQPDEAAAKNIQANSDLSLFCAELLTVRGYRTIEETASQFSCPALSDPFLIRDMQAWNWGQMWFIIFRSGRKDMV